MFQYISCYSLSGIAGGNARIDEVSIHLMLLFIHQQRNSNHGLWFQYISCYSLSCTDLLLPVWKSSFQYISCYSLSGSGTAWATTKIEFQYISCYSLSPVANNYDQIPMVSIHLMLLFIGILVPFFSF